jgi:hypothetical protein
MIYKQNEIAIKAIKDRVIHGVGVRFGSAETKDWDGEFFHSESEVGLKNGSERPFLMEHGFGKKFGINIVGSAIYEKGADGWTYEASFLDTPVGNQAYNEIITHAYRSSAGAAGHTRRATLEKGAFRLDTWLIAEQSATQTPADPENPRITRTKTDYILFAIKEMQEEHEAKVKEIIEIFAKDANESRQKLADALSSLRTSFSSDNGKGFVVTEEFLASIEQVTKPIEILSI